MVLYRSCFVLLVVVLLYYLRKTLFFYERVKGFVLNIGKGNVFERRTQYSFVHILYIGHLGLLFFSISILRSIVLHSLLIWASCGIGNVCRRYVCCYCADSQRAGPWHFAIMEMMMLYGVNVTDAGIFALIVHGIQTFWLFCWCVYGLTSA